MIDKTITDISNFLTDPHPIKGWVFILYMIVATQAYRLLCYIWKECEETNTEISYFQYIFISAVMFAFIFAVATILIDICGGFSK